MKYSPPVKEKSVDNSSKPINQFKRQTSPENKFKRKDASKVSMTMP